MKFKIKWSIILIIAILISLTIWIAYSNSNIEINEITVQSVNIPEAFDGLRIAQVSDLHNAEFGQDNEKLVQLLRQTEADIIVITGDIVDSRKTDIEVALSFAEKAVEIASTYYVNGNHESGIPEYESLKQGLIKRGVTVLENEAAELTIGNETVSLIGVTDPSFPMKFVDDTMEQNISHQLSNVIPDNGNYKILLAHRPEYFKAYAQNDVDLVFSGHAHGGQFILPFVGGVVAPGQGFFPEYYQGIYTENDTNMIVSRGIGNSLFPFRINNNPEIVVAVLSAS